MPDQTCDNLRSMSAFGQLRTIVDFGPAVCPLMTQSGQWRLQFILPDLDGGCHKARPNGTLHIRHIKLWLKDINAQPRSKLNLVMQRSIFARGRIHRGSANRGWYFMSKKAAEHHKKAAEHHTHAAHHHSEAAKHHEGGRHEKAGHHAHTARGHALHARDHSEEAAKGHMEEHGKK